MGDTIEELQLTLPMPLAQLTKRALNASAGRDQHDAAFYLGEATLKLAAAARIGRWLSLGPEPDAPLARKLEGLVLPSMGHWMGFLRDTTAALAERQGGASDPLAARAALTRSRKDFPAVAALTKAAVAEQIATAALSAQTAKNGVLGFFDLLVTYRNRVLGHSGQRVPAFYQEMGELLLAALNEVLRVPELFGGLELVLPRVEVSSGGSAATRLRVLRGLGVTSRATSGQWRPGELYFVGEDDYRAPLMPLVVFAESREQHERFGFLNGTDSKDRDVIKRVEYLDYATCLPLDGVDTTAELISLLGKLRGAPVNAGAVRETMVKIAESTEHPADAAREEGSASPTHASPLRGLVGTTLLGRYRVLRMIGEGGMGAVYEVEHATIGTRQALKVLHPSLAQRGEYLTRFAREAREAAQTKHPGIVQVTDHGRLDDGSAYLLMELLAGESLQERIDRGPLSIDDTIAIGVAALDALHAAHERGVIHRDIKPDNLFLPSDPAGPKVKIVDFGIAKSADESEKLTMDGAILGTANYMAPEQLGNSRNADARADVYAVGATLFACLTGQSPATGSDLRALLGNVAQGAIERDARRRRPDTPDSLATVIERALQLAPSARFESAAVMRDALSAPPSGGVDAVGATIAASPVTGSSASMVAPARGATPAANPGAGTRLVIGAVCAMGAVGAAGWWVSTQGKEAQQRPPSSAIAPPSAPASGAAGAPMDAASAPAPSALPAGPWVQVKGATFQLGLAEDDLIRRRKACIGATCAELLAPLERAARALEVSVSTFWIGSTEVSVSTYAAWLDNLHKAGELQVDPRTGNVTRGRDRVARIAGTDGELSYARLALEFDPARGFRVVSGREQEPMVMVTWAGAQLHCRSLGGRLPTEAEWDLAARGPARDPYVWGSKELDASRCDSVAFGRAADLARWGAPGPGPCGARPDSYDPVGATDVTPATRGEPIMGLAGNVREWVLDEIESEPKGYPACAATPCKDPWRAMASSALSVAPPPDAPVAGPATPHVTRGCSFLDDGLRCHAAARGLLEGDDGDVRLGFRCAKKDAP